MAIFFITMKDYAEKFYKSKQWQRCSSTYKKSVGGLCERCKAKGFVVAGVIVHHKIRITPKNINDVSITLNPDNLELLCKKCHNEEHKAEINKTNYVKRFQISESGELIIKT